MKTGLTSVTFRQKSVDEIILLAQKAHLDGIEWGGDVHVPAGDTDTAASVREKCIAAGLEILSYGSYYKALPDQDFAPVLASARALGAPMIRIWAGNCTPDSISEDAFRTLAANIRRAAESASQFGIAVALEYHRGTMTQTKEGAVRLLQAVDHPNLYTYWQPNPDVSMEERLREIQAISPWLRCCHVFAWTAGNERHPLAEQTGEWSQYLEAVRQSGKKPNLVMEFVCGDSAESFLQDAEILHKLSPKETIHRAAFLCNGDRLLRVYDSRTLSELDQIVSLPRIVVTSDTMEEYAPLLKNAEYLFSTWGMPALTGEQIEKYLPSLKAVFYGAGSVQAFARPFLEKGIRVFSAWGANAIPVAEYATAQIILAGKGFFQCVDHYRHEGRKAAREFTDHQPGNYNIRIGILGAGMIGRMVLERLMCYDVETLVYDPFVSDAVLESLHAKRASLTDIFRECQVISNHIANLPSTVGMLKYEHFSLMKKNATFINTGRGAQIVEEDMIRALQEEPERTAILDVTFPEPPVPESPLNTMRNVILTPHIAGSMNNEVARMGKYMLEEARKLLTGQPCKYEVTEKMLETMA